MIGWSPRSFSRVAASVEQHLAQLRGGVDVELAAGLGHDRFPLLGHFGDQAIGQGLKLLAIDADAQVLHAGQHPHERYFNLVVQLGEAAGLQRLAHRRSQRSGCQCSTGGHPIAAVAIAVAVAQVELAVVVGNVGIAFVDGFLREGGLGAAHGALEQQVPEQEAAEGAVGVDGLPVGETAVA